VAFSLPNTFGCSQPPSPNTTLNPGMKNTHSPGEYLTQTLTHPIDNAEILVGFASRLLIKLRPVDIQHRVDDISKQFTGAGWKNLPQEIVDEIMGLLLLDNFAALKACSLTCKRLFGATRPLIHQRLVCWGSAPNPIKPKRSLFSRRQREPGDFEQLIDRDRLGILRYTRHLTLRRKLMTSQLYYPKDIQEYLPHLRSITKLHTLTLVRFHIPTFTPVFNEHFGMFTNTLRHLDIRHANGAEQDLSLLYIVSQFHLLEDLTIVSSPRELPPHTGHLTPTIIQSPPLCGNLALVDTRSRELSDGLAAFPGGLNFRSLELSSGRHSQALLAACGHTVTLISCLLRSYNDYSESSSSIQVDIAI